MEDNVRNELLENGRIHAFLRSGTSRVSTKPDNVNLSIVSSKSKLRQRHVKEQHALVSQSHHTTAYTTANSEETKAFSSNSDITDIVSEKVYTENGLSSSKNIQTLAGGHIPNNLPNHKHINQSSDVSDSKWSSTRKSAYLFYKAAGEWWNIFPKTDYTYSKSSTCRKEIAPGIMTMPNMSRSPLHSYWDRKSMDRSQSFTRSTLNKSISEDYSDDAFISSSTHNTTFRTSLVIRIMTTIWHIFTSISSVLTLQQYRLGFESTPVRGRGGHVMENSLYRKLEVMCYQSACYFLLLDTWILSLFHRSRHSDHQLVNKKRQSKYLFLLLIPPLLFFGLWYNSASTSPMAVLSSFMSGVVNLLPSLSVQKTSISDVVTHEHLTSEDGNMELLVQKILSSSEFKEILLKQDFRSEEQQQQNGETILASVKLEQERLKMQLDHENRDLDLALGEQKKILMEQEITNKRLSLEYSALIDRIEQLKMQMKSLQAQSLHLSRRVGDCRKIIIQSVPKIEIEQHVTNFLTGLFDATDSQSNNPENIKIWIKTLLMAKENIEERLTNTMTVVNERITEATGKSAEVVMASVSDMIKQEFLKQEAKFHASGTKYISAARESVSGDPCNGCSLSIDQVEEIVNRALHLYDADKTGMVDYALESAGGTVINIRCTENFNERSLALAFLGMTLPWSSNHPRIALQPDVHPGRCWAFRGAQGYLVIRLAKMIKVSAFSIEHIPVSISHAGNIDAAPKNFSVWGLNNETDREQVLLGKYMYDSIGPPLQTFPIQNTHASPYQIIELAIESNHGNLEYTCLYRFRVHGIAV